MEDCLCAVKASCEIGGVFLIIAKTFPPIAPIPANIKIMTAYIINFIDPPY